jgi:hypothetical protein
MFVWPHLKKAGWKRKRPTGRVGRFVVNGRGGQPGPPPHRSSLAPGRRMMIVSDTGPTGFEPAVSGLTGRCVKPGYTTAPTALIIPQSAFFVKRPLVASAAPIFGPGCLVGQLRAVVLPDQTEKKEAFLRRRSRRKNASSVFGQRPSQGHLSDRGWTHQRRTPFSTAEATSPRNSSTSRCPRTSEMARKRLMGSRRGNRERVSS